MMKKAALRCIAAGTFPAASQSQASRRKVRKKPGRAPCMALRPMIPNARSWAGSPALRKAAALPLRDDLPKTDYGPAARAGVKTRTSRKSSLAGDKTSLSDLAGRYAFALLDLADEKKALDQVSGDLQTLRAMIAESEDLRRLLNSPIVTREEQRDAMSALMDRAGIAELTRRFEIGRAHV